MRLKVVGGEAPFAVPGDLRPHLGLDVANLPIGDARGFMFALEIRAVDLNGNVGAPVVLTIVDEPPPEDGGCAVGAGGGSAASLGLALGALALATRRRRG